MAARSVLPLIALLMGAVLLSPKKAKAETKKPPPPVQPGEPGFPPPVQPGEPGFVPPPPPHGLELDALFTIRNGDLPAAFASYYGRDFHELQDANSGQNWGGTVAQQIAGGWQVGNEIIIPGSWLPFSKPLPRPGSSKVAAVPEQYPTVR